MKKYDSKLKKWVSQEEWDKSHKPRNKDICRGKKPHDFVLTLPFGVSYNEHYKFNPEKYYEIMDEINDFEEQQNKRAEAIGIVFKYRRFSRREIRLFVCSVCKKQKYIHE